MEKKPRQILMARIGAAHGIRGEVRVKSFTADPLALVGYGPLQSADGRQFTIAHARPQKTVLVVGFEGISTREAAEALNGVELFIDRNRLPEPDDEDEFYLEDLAGLDAVDDDGAIIGKVKSVENYGAGDILELQLATGGTEMIAFTKANVPHVDVAAGRITVLIPQAVIAEDEGK